MKRLVGVLLLVSSIAHADERSATFTLGGMGGAFGPKDPDVVGAEGIVGPRMGVAWETPALAMPVEPGYRFGGALVPELVGGAFLHEDRAEMFFGAGVRAELRISQRQQGLLKVSARGASYIAARGLVVGERRKGFGEFALGYYILLGRAARLGFEGSLIIGRPEMDAYDARPHAGGVMQAYVGWTP